MAITKAKLIADGVITVGNLHESHGITTTHIGEGDKLFYTDTRVSNYLSANNYITTSDVPNLETVTSLSISANILSYTDEAGLTTNIDLSTYLDDTNLARLVSGTLNAGTGIATFTRDDSSTFTIDFSAFLADANDYVSSGSFNTSTGVLTLTRLGGGTVTVDLDGKYAEASHTHLWADITDAPTALSFFTNDLGNYGGFVEVESDPTVPYHVKIISISDVANWNLAYGWGNHAGLYLGVGAKAADSELLDGIDSSKVIYGSNSTGTSYISGATLDTALKSGFYTTNGGVPNATAVNFVLHTAYYGEGNLAGFDLACNDSTSSSFYLRPATGGGKGAWQTIITSSNIGSQSVNYANGAGNSTTTSQRSFNYLYATDYLETSGAVYGTVFYDNNDRGYYLNPQGFSNLGRIKFNDVVSSGEPVGDAVVGRNYAYNTLELKGYGSEMMIGSQSTDLHINYRYCNNTGNSTYTPQTWYWRNGTSGGWSNHYWGIGHGVSSLRAPIFYDYDNTGYYVDPNGTSNLNTVQANKIRNDGSVSSDDGFGIYWDSGESTAYAIYREGGAWSDPYPDLRIAFHTGIKLGANSGYSGIRFYTDYDMATQVMSVNNGSDGYGAGHVYVNNIMHAGGSHRAPIFYDSNDTGYYAAPAGTTRLNRLYVNQRNDNYNIGSLVGTNPVNDWQSLTNTEGQWTVAQYNAIGSYANTPANVYTYGAVMSWRTTNHSFQLYASHTGDLSYKTQWNNDNYSGWKTPVVYGFNGGSSSGKSIYGDTFYDSDNSGYYINPASTSVMATVSAGTLNGSDVYTTGGWFRNHTNSNGIYWSATAWHLYPKNASDFYVRSGTSDASIHFIRGGTESNYIHNASDNAIGFLNTGRNWIFRVDNGGSATAYGDMRSPVFYDHNNTSYYLDPTAGSNSKALMVDGFVGWPNHQWTWSRGAHQDPTNSIKIWDQYSDYGGSGNPTAYGTILHITGRSGHEDDQLYFSYDGQILHRNAFYGSDSWSSWNSVATARHSFTNNVDLRAPIFYDSNDTGYYIDPNSGGTCFRGAGSVNVNGDVTAYYSDMRLKTKIADIKNPIEKVKSLSGFIYEPNEIAESYGYKKEQKVGVSAQEVQAVLPEAVKDAPIGNGYLTVQYDKLVPLLIEAIKEQQEQIEELKAIVNGITK